MKKVLFLIFALALFNSLSYAQSDSTKSAVSDTAYIVVGDKFYDEYNEEKALENYLKALEINGANYEALWRAARSYIAIGDAAKKEERKKNYVEAEKLARKLVKLYPNKAEAHFRLAEAIGKIALYEGGKKKIELSKELKEEADRAIELDPTHDGAYHIVARWHREIANLSWVLKAAAKVVYGGVPKGASNEKSVENFLRAIELRPDKIIHRLEIGKTYIKMKEWDKARASLQKAIDLPINDSRDETRKEEAKKLLKEIKNK